MMADKIIHEIDRFSSVNINAGRQAISEEEFFSNFNDALNTWTQEGRKGVWLTIPKDFSSYVPKLTEVGFDFHHAQPGYVMMVKWLPTDLPNNLPAYANHYVGVAGFVVNDKNQLLVIREKYFNETKPSPWKLPGGLADKREDLCQTAEREVLEETGVRAKFKSVLAFRHMHGYRFGCSDFYFVCLMSPLNEEIKSCPNEIAECRWMDMDEYENYLIDNDISDVNQYFVKQYKQISGTDYSLAPHDVRSYYKDSINIVYGIDCSTKPSTS